MFIGLNPSTADETQDDPTVRRCMGFALSWGYGGLLMTNLFAYRSTDPALMKAHPEPIGPKNNSYLELLSHQAGIVVAAWGIHGTFEDRDKEVLPLLKRPHYLALTKDSIPRHPLYLRADTKPQPLF
jgi:hypothetical protein